MSNVTSPRGRTRVTNDDLARMIAEGFRQVDSRFNKVDGRLDGVEGRLEKVETRLTTVEMKLDRALYSEYMHLERRVTRLEKKTGLTE